jgi:hypothetical protein
MGRIIRFPDIQLTRKRINGQAAYPGDVALISEENPHEGIDCIFNSILHAGMRESHRLKRETSTLSAKACGRAFRSCKLCRKQTAI